MNRAGLRLAGPVAGAALIAATVCAPAASAASPVDVPFASTGAEQSWVVPAGVTSIHVVVGGGHGMNNGTLQGGFGAVVAGDLAVTPGDTLYIEVGGSSAVPQTPAFNGGGAIGTGSGGGAGAGGGASDIRTVSRVNPAATTLASRLVVAGGGGGAGSGSVAAGGNAGQQGGAGISATGGNPGTGASGGTGGQTGGGTGSLGQGGTGGGGILLGGGGGGGYYGGGGGGSGSFDGGGGGGGSSFMGTLTNSSLAVSTGIGFVTITYTPAPDPTPGPSATPAPDTGTVGAQVTVPSSAACLEVSTASVDFGTLPPGSEDQPATPDITITNCSALSSDIYAHATDATDGAGATWALQDTNLTCADGLAVDTYRLGLEQSGTETGLGTTNKLLESLSSAGTGTHTARIFTACPGSSGSGSVMSMQITFLATTGG